MTQKQSLAHALDFAERDSDESRDSRLASRATFVILWLEDMNWHNEAGAIAERVATTPRLRGESAKLRRDKRREDALHESAALLNKNFGWTLDPGEWCETQGAALVEELWELIMANA